MRVLSYALVVFSGCALFAIGQAVHRTVEFQGPEVVGVGVIVFGCVLLWREAHAAGLFGNSPPPPPVENNPPQ
jgi:hypothetical protein